MILIKIIKNEGGWRKMKNLVYILMLTTLLSCNNKKQQHPTDMDTSEQINENHVNKSIEMQIEKKEKPINFAEYIKLTNCTITTDYSVPNIINRVIGINDDEPPIGQSIENNSLRFIWGGFQIVLRNDIPLNKDIIIIAKNSKNEFNRKLNLKPIQKSLFDNYSDNNDVLGFYDNVLFENKFWLHDGNRWQFTVNSNDIILLSGEIPSNLTTSMVFEKLDETPFAKNNLSSVSLFRKYTYRCIKEDTELVVIYNLDNHTYRPILYLIPDKNGTAEYIDIGICWNDEKVRGVYLFKNYEIDKLPTEEEMYAILGSIEVK